MYIHNMMYLCMLLSDLESLAVDGEIPLLGHQRGKIDRKPVGVIKSPGNITYMYMYVYIDTGLKSNNGGKCRGYFPLENISLICTQKLNWYKIISQIISLI